MSLCDPSILRSTKTNAVSDPACPRWETWCVALFALGFLLFNLVTSTRYPFVWIDEVMYSDPAVNLFLGNGFTSSAWYIQHAGEFWAGNVPLHSLLLCGWMKLFGFSILAVRSINYVYLIGGCLLLWRACLRLNLVATSRARLLLLGLVAGGYSVIFSYRSGRPDCLALLVVCAFIYAHSLERRWRRNLVYFLLGLLSPWVGLQLLPLLAVGGILLLFYLGWNFLPQLGAAYGGVAVGLATLVSFYVSHGVFGQFLKSIRQHTAVGLFQMLARGEFRHSNLIPKDFSFMILFLLAVALAVRQFRRGTFKSALSFGLVYSIALSITLVLSGKFPTYYGWMTYLPLSLCVCAALAQARPDGALPRLSGILLAAAIGVGVLLNAATAAYDWKDRDYANVEKLVRENVTGSDWMYGEFSTYYAAKGRVARTFMPMYLPSFLPDEKERVTVLLVAPKDLEEVTNVIGGNWVSTGKRFVPERSGFLGTKMKMGFLSTQNYELEVYRRAEHSLP